MAHTQKTKSYCLILACLCGIMALFPQIASAADFAQWHYHADTTVHPQADPTYEAVYADFTHLLKSTFHTSGALDENSIRVVPLQNGQPGAAVNYRFVKAANFDAATNAAGTLIFEVAATKDPATADYRVYFDTASNGANPPFANSDNVPETANMIWNGDFEILSADYKGDNRYANPGENMPRGWWGNMRSFLDKNEATSAHSGKHAMGFVTPKDKQHVSIASAPSPPGLRLTPGQSYLFSFWIKGENLTSRYPVTASVYWYDKDGKFLTRSNISANSSDPNNFDWAETEIYLTAPDDACFASMYIGTYSQTGLLTVDDINVRVAVPPLLQ